MRVIRKGAFVFILFLIMVISVSCSKKEVIKIDPLNHCCTLKELINTDIEKSYKKAVEKPVLFTNYDDYEKFAKEYFRDYSRKDFDFEKYDFLLINGKKINSKEYKFCIIDSIIKEKDKVQLVIEHGDKATIDKLGQNEVIQAVSYAFFTKGTINTDDEIQVIKE